mmetsp:Transcript_1718/g.5573  ORF Transcript_1718/g.5573 Transcript_1718/m.5573 type:complete len:202 (+) Transcript_1718:1182-1787(+)
MKCLSAGDTRNPVGSSSSADTERRRDRATTSRSRARSTPLAASSASAASKAPGMASSSATSTSSNQTWRYPTLKRSLVGQTPEHLPASTKALVNGDDAPSARYCQSTDALASARNSPYAVARQPSTTSPVDSSAAGKSQVRFGGSPPKSKAATGVVQGRGKSAALAAAAAGHDRSRAPSTVARSLSASTPPVTTKHKFDAR